MLKLLVYLTTFLVVVTVGAAMFSGLTDLQKSEFEIGGILLTCAMVMLLMGSVGMSAAVHQHGKHKPRRPAGSSDVQKLPPFQGLANPRRLPPQGYRAEDFAEPEAHDNPQLAANLDHAQRLWELTGREQGMIERGDTPLTIYDRARLGQGSDAVDSEWRED